MYKKINFILIIIVSVIAAGILCSYEANSEGTQKEEYKITKIDIFKGTPVWDLALAVRDQKTSKIEKIAKANSQLLDYQESKYDITLLLWAVGMEKYR